MFVGFGWLFSGLFGWLVVWYCFVACCNCWFVDLLACCRAVLLVGWGVSWLVFCGWILVLVCGFGCFRCLLAVFGPVVSLAVTCYG